MSRYHDIQQNDTHQSGINPNTLRNVLFIVTFFSCAILPSVIGMNVVTLKINLCSNENVRDANYKRLFIRMMINRKVLFLKYNPSKQHLIPNSRLPGTTTLSLVTPCRMTLVRVALIPTLFVMFYLL
jgi:hypothetical protein